MIDSPDQFATAADLGLMEGFPPPAEKRVNHSNAFWVPPYNRWSYQNMRMFFPSAGIANAAVASPLPQALDPAVAGLEVAEPDEHGRPSGRMVDMETHLRETYTDALVVVQGDRIVYERFLNGMTPGQPHQMMSVTKSFAGLFALMAVEAGQADEDDPVTKHVPELTGAGAFRDATFGQVLDMTNAMDFTEDYADPTSDIHEYVVVVGLEEPRPGMSSIATAPFSPAAA